MAFFTMIAPLVALTYPIDKVKDGKEPNGYASTKTYTEETKNVTVYNYYAYKIVKVTDASGKTTVSLKLWFLDDVK